jgi:hypothetical protein
MQIFRKNVTACICTVPFTDVSEGPNAFKETLNQEAADFSKRRVKTAVLHCEILDPCYDFDYFLGYFPLVSVYKVISKVKEKRCT